MYGKLTESYALRGWEKLPCVLVRRPFNLSRAMSPEQFRVLMLCDGRTQLDPGVLSNREREALDTFLKDGVVASCGEPSPIAPAQEYQRYPNRYVQSVFWSVTGRCNYRCRHCYMDAPEGVLGELSHEAALDLIAQMARCGVLRVDLTGGEALVRSDFWELVDAILSNGIAIGQVYTNGWLVDRELLEKFEQREIKPEFSVSFDGVGWHDWMRGVEGAEEAALRALRQCVAHGFPVNVEMCIHKGNAQTLRETVRLLSELGVPRMKVAPVSDTPLWNRNNQGNAFSFREYCEAMIDYIPHFFRDGCPINLHLGNIIQLFQNSAEYRVTAERYHGTDQSKKCHLCGAARYACYITPDGRLLPCMPMTACKEQELFPKVADIGLQKGLSESYYMEFVDRRVHDLIESNEKCRECPHVLRCGGGCRAMALAQTGDLMGADEDQCLLWNEGYVERIRQTAEDAVRRFRPVVAQDGPAR